MPGPTTGREYEIFGSIEQDSHGAFWRGRVRQRGPAPRVLCNDAEVVKSLVGISGCERRLTRLVGKQWIAFEGGNGQGGNGRGRGSGKDWMVRGGDREETDRERARKGRLDLLLL